MSLQETVVQIQEALKVNPSALDTMDNVRWIGNIDNVNEILTARNMDTLNEEQLESLYRIQLFEADTAEGKYEFATWDVGNTALAFTSELTHEALVGSIQN